MSKKYLVSIDFSKLEALNFRLQNLATAPSSPVSGQFYYDTVAGTGYIWNGSQWNPTDPAKALNASIPFAALIGAAPIASPTFTGLVTMPTGDASNAGGLKIPSGTLKSSPVAGDSGRIEYDGTSMYYIDSTGTRRTFGVSGTGIASLTLTQPAAGFTITSGGTGTNPTYTFALSDDLAAVEGLSSTGIVRRTGTNTWSAGTAVSLTTEVTGTLPVANGGTGVTTSTGTGNVVLSASPTLSGTPLSTTAAADTSTTQIATTAFVVGQAGSATPAALGTATVGTSLRYARQDHVHAMPTHSQVGAPTADVAWGSFKITNLADPTSAQDAATKNYVDNAVASLSWKDEVRLATTANVTLSGGAPNTLDGGSLSVNDRILVKDQSSPAQNGIYIVQTVGTGSNGTWVRSSDADTAAEVKGMAVFVSEGTVNGGYRYVCSTTGAITLGTTALNFVVFDAVVSYTNGNGLNLSGNTFSVKPDTGISVSASGVAVDTSVVVRKYAATIGDGSATSIAVTHSLGTQDVTVSIRDASTNLGVECDWTATSTSVVTLTFAVAPASNAYRVVVHG